MTEDGSAVLAGSSHGSFTSLHAGVDNSSSGFYCAWLPGDSVAVKLDSEVAKLWKMQVRPWIFTVLVSKCFLCA